MIARISAIVGEALRSIRSQPVASAATSIMVAGMCVAVLLTAGRAVGAEDAVLASIDSAGTRTIVVNAADDAGLDSSVIGRLSGVEGISWAGAFSSPTDARNARLVDGPTVPVRRAWLSSTKPLSISRQNVGVGDQNVWLSRDGLRQVRIDQLAGGLVDTNGGTYSIRGSLTVPASVQFMEPLAITLQKSTLRAPVNLLVVVARSPSLVAPVAAAVKSLLGITDPTKVQITTSESLATLRALVQQQLSGFSGGLVLAIFAITGTLVAAILLGLVTLRRKDFGRRRALGASRSLIVTLLVSQVGILAAGGAAFGCVVAQVVLVTTGAPAPRWDFDLALAVLAIAVSLIASLPPAIVAARRDPLTELRVP